MYASGLHQKHQLLSFISPFLINNCLGNHKKKEQFQSHNIVFTCIVSNISTTFKYNTTMFILGKRKQVHSSYNLP